MSRKTARPGRGLAAREASVIGSGGSRKTALGRNLDLPVLARGGFVNVRPCCKPEFGRDRKKGGIGAVLVLFFWEYVVYRLAS